MTAATPLNKKIGKYADLSLVDIHAGFWEIENNLEKAGIYA